MDDTLEHLRQAFIKAARYNGWVELTCYTECELVEGMNGLWSKVTRELTADELKAKCDAFIKAYEQRVMIGQPNHITEKRIYKAAKEYAVYCDEGAKALMMYKLSVI